MGYIKHVRRFRTLALFALILFSLIFPLLNGDPSLTAMAVTVLLLTGAAAAWNIFSGYTGYISLGHATYYGIGAYALALACQGWSIGGYGPFLLLPLAGLIAAAFSIPLGWVALRTRRYTFIIVTIGFFFIFRMLAYNLSGITNSDSGIFLPLPPWSADYYLYDILFYYIALTFLLVVTVVSWWIRHSRFGLILLAVRDDEDRAHGLGIRVERHKLGAYALSAAFTGMIGALSVYFAGFITPSFAFEKTFDITIVTQTFFGGIGSLTGPIVGGLLLEPLQTYLNQQYGPTGTGLNLILFGSFLLAVILLLPEGVVPSLSMRWQEWTAAHHARTIRETLQPSNADEAGVAPVELVSSLAFQEELVGRVLIEEQPNQSANSLPLHFVEQARVLPLSLRFAKKVRLIRLEPLPPGESLANTQRQVRASATVSWRCPACGKPFLLRGTTCYCPRCGFTRSLSEEKQLASFLPEIEHPAPSRKQ